MRIGSLFSGYGGLDMAVEDVFPGAVPAWFCEWDDAPSRILAHHWPDVPNLRDVTAVDWSQVEPVDIITGGSPCQDLSAAGRRAGMTEGTRSNLWVAMREAIIQLRPRYVVWENVQGALSASASSDSDVEPGSGSVGGRGGHLRALGRVLGDLTEAGYDSRWTTVRASDVGAPHHRARVFLVATPTDAGRRGWGQGTEQPVSGSAEVAATVSGDAHLADPASSGRERETLTGVQRGEPAHGDRNILNTEGVRCDGRRAAPGQAGRSHAATDRPGVVDWGKYGPAVRRWERLTRTAPMPTEPNTKGNPRLNAEFAEWMMGLPHGHVTGVGLPRTAQLKAIGNGVCPQQAAAALEQLLALEAVTA